jgi:hypothetical protein
MVNGEWLDIWVTYFELSQFALALGTRHHEAMIREPVNLTARASAEETFLSL